MESLTTTLSVGQVMSQLFVDSGASQSTGALTANFILYQYVVQEVPSFSIPPNLVNELDLAQLYAEFADEDRDLANMGLAQYARMIRDEDSNA